MKPIPEEQATSPEAPLAPTPGPSSDQAIQRLLDQPLLAEDMQEATERVARPLQPPEKHVLRLLAFHLCGQAFAVAARNVAKVKRAAPVRRVPHRTNAIIRGLCHVDGDLLLCADLANLLEVEAATPGPAQQNLDPTTNRNRRMIVLEDQSHLWAVEVDTVDGVIAAVPADLRTPPLTVDAETGHFTANVLQRGNQLVAVLDLPRVLKGFQAALS